MNSSLLVKHCLRALAARRLEELALEHPEANLRAFDPRLAAAAKALRGDGRWSQALAAGGSDAAALAAPVPAAGAEVQEWPLSSAPDLSTTSSHESGLAHVLHDTPHRECA